MLAILATLALQVTALQTPALRPGGPAEYGRDALRRALEAPALRALTPPPEIEVVLAKTMAPESFRVECQRNHVVITAGDEAGAMYGAFELAAEIGKRGAAALGDARFSGAPFLRDRGVNAFLTLPWDYAKNGPDYDPASLTRADKWWFHDDDYWDSLLDIMARARLNWLDLHGTYDIHTTGFPNLYAYFVRSEKFPEVGVASEIQAKNLERLNAIIEKAHRRGVRVSLMSYEARFGVPHHPKTPYQESETNVYEYTREVVEKMIRGAPGLDAIGFRIGESGHGGEFFRCYTEAVARSGRDIPLLTRSWITRKAKVVPLARASSDFTVEIKFNGEQWGPPYPIAGGRVPGWHSYSFEDYLDSSALLSPEIPTKRMWRGNDAARGERWPDEPYKIVWQVRANGTLRIFPFFEPEWIRRTVMSMAMGTASGFTVEPRNAYYPASTDYYRAEPAPAGHRWVHERDRAELTLWGRLGYDPTWRTPRDAAIEVLGDDAPLIDAWEAASRVIPTAFTAFANGPDHRDHAPELEWGGDTQQYIEAKPFDSHVFKGVQEQLAYQITGGLDGRRPLTYAGLRLNAIARGIDPKNQTWDAMRSRAAEPAHELAFSIPMEAALAKYYAARFLGVYYGAISDASGKNALVSENNGFVKEESGIWLSRARDAWRDLASSPAAKLYKPFTDRLRMGTHEYHWRSELPKVEAEVAKYPGPSVPDDSTPDPSPRSLGTQLSWRADADSIVCTVRQAASTPADRRVTRAWLLEKPLPSSTFFHKKEMRDFNAASPITVTTRFPRKAWGHLLAADVQVGEAIIRIPDWANGAPYLVVPPLDVPTPPLYSSQEALTYLKPEILDPKEISMLLVAPRAWDFHRHFGVDTQRKLLEAVERGIPLLVLQQDWASGRYPLAWLPKPLRVENHPTTTFEPDGMLGLRTIETRDIIFQHFLPSDGWTLSKDGSVATLPYGKGSISIVAARLLQRMHVPDCARTLLALFKDVDRSKRIAIVDAGSEGNLYSTSVFPDFLNAHSIPFATLGELIAEKQGADCLAPVAGPVAEDSVLGGRGAAMQRAFLEAKAKKLAARPTPANAADFETWRAPARRELLRDLGLDPAPPRTDLNAKIVGTVDRPDYRIEKLVFESRQGFPVTANVYVPRGSEGKRLPVIVNPHGHWAHKKSEPVVQSRAIAQALRGYLAIVVDSPGYSFEGDAPIERRSAGPHDDLRLILASTNATAFYVWDLIRLLDYLETRPDADMKHVGITGTSGGGLATLYAFAAEERFTCAVPVCFATSLEVSPHNGCLCNHVPATLQIGDRADVLAIRAPAPVLVIGATDDNEFPPAGTKLTGEKLARLWSVLGAEKKVGWKLVNSGHDYNQPMREAAMGFFDLHLRGIGDGSPVAEPKFKTEPAESEELRCLPLDAPGQTMNAIARERVPRYPKGGPHAGAAADGEPSIAEFFALNGGVPAAVVNRDVASLHWETRPGKGAGRSIVTFDSEPGLTIPGILDVPATAPRGALVIVSERGKLGAADDFDVAALVAAGFACLRIDARGTGEFGYLDGRLMAYLGTGIPFAMGIDAARAAAGLLATYPKVGILGRGPVASQAAHFAAFMERRIGFLASVGGLGYWSEAFGPKIPLTALQPRADHAPTLNELRIWTPCRKVFTFGEEPAPNLFPELDYWISAK